MDSFHIMNLINFTVTNDITNVYMERLCIINIYTENIQCHLRKTTAFFVKKTHPYPLGLMYMGICVHLKCFLFPVNINKKNNAKKTLETAQCNSEGRQSNSEARLLCLMSRTLAIRMHRTYGKYF